MDNKDNNTNLDVIKDLNNSVKELKTTFENNSKLSDYSKTLTDLTKAQLQVSESKDYVLLNKIFTLKSVMTASIGEGPFQEGQKSIFAEDELLEYKGKMLELINQL